MFIVIEQKYIFVVTLKKNMKSSIKLSIFVDNEEENSNSEFCFNVSGIVCR